MWVLRKKTGPFWWNSLHLSWFGGYRYQVTWRNCQLGGLAHTRTTTDEQNLEVSLPRLLKHQGICLAVTTSHSGTTRPGTDMLLLSLDSESCSFLCAFFRPGIVQSNCTYILHEAKLTSRHPCGPDEETEAQRGQLMPGHTNQKVAKPGSEPGVCLQSTHLPLGCVHWTQTLSSVQEPSSFLWDLTLSQLGISQNWLLGGRLSRPWRSPGPLSLTT